MSEIFTPPQKKILSDFKNGRLKRINLLDGSVRSGKTWISLVLWALWTACTLGSLYGVDAEKRRLSDGRQDAQNAQTELS